ncbi:MAG: hypothetical protein WCO78_01870 [Candidatus Roizmanbacteria bacterium]
MTPIQPPLLPCYFSLRKNYTLPKGIAVAQYISWEDALWDMIDVYKIQKGSIVLIPTFWCMDVVKNIEAHGLRCEYYPMDQNFQSEVKDFIRAIDVYKPAFIIIFHAVGIRNLLIAKYEEWKDHLDDQQIVIEDSVHSIVDPSLLVIKRDRHFVVDSWRKVIPLQGSTIYGKGKELRKFDHTHKSLSNYSLRVVWLWLKMQSWLVLSAFRFPKHIDTRLFSNKWDELCAKKAEKYMLEGYDLTGDCITAGATLRIFILLRKHINVSRIKKIKEKQVAKYDKLLQPLWDDLRFVHISISQYDPAELRGYPVVIVAPEAASLINALRDSGVLVRSELEGCPWTQDKKVVYLPLGPHVGSGDIARISDAVLCVQNA